MIWILLAALGVPVWLVVGALAAAILSRRAFKRDPGVFPAKLRVVSGRSVGLGSSWQRMPVYVRWVHDVLIVHQGVALVRNRALPVARITGSLVPGSPEDVKRLGPQPILMTLVLDDGATVECVAPADARDLMVGPFAGALL